MLPDVITIGNYTSIVVARQLYLQSHNHYLEIILQILVEFVWYIWCLIQGIGSQQICLVKDPLSYGCRSILWAMISPIFPRSSKPPPKSVALSSLSCEEKGEYTSSMHPTYISIQHTSKYTSVTSSLFVLIFSSIFCFRTGWIWSVKLQKSFPNRFGAWVRSRPSMGWEIDCI